MSRERRAETRTEAPSPEPVEGEATAFAALYVHHGEEPGEVVVLAFRREE
ncbi:MAG: hypothetical protein KC731_12650 [Myxococcales bacterium]|nr:hypothetical protein [Myxococcales bacterium]